MLFLWKRVRDFRTFVFCCSRVHAFWDEVTVMFNSQAITFKSLDIKDIFFVFFVFFFDVPNHDNDGILLNYIVL